MMDIDKLNVLLRKINDRNLAGDIAGVCNSLITEARKDEVYRYLERSDSLGESKYATRRIKELEAQLNRKEGV